MQNVIAVDFEQESSAYEALTNLKELNDQNQIDLTGAAVVVREQDGRVTIKDSTGDTGFSGAATGGIIGLLIGIIGGPFGVLLGGATGLLVGSLFDMEDADETDSVLEAISRSVHPGRTALLAEADEPSPDVIDNAMKRLAGTVIRESVDDVKAEIAAAEDAQKAARKEARKLLREQRRNQVKEKIQQAIQDLKAKLHHEQPVGAGG